MNEAAEARMPDAVNHAAKRVADSVQHATDQVQQAVCKTQGGIGEVREVIRAQPIVSALMVFTLGYLFGRLGALIPSRH